MAGGHFCHNSGIQVAVTSGVWPNGNGWGSDIENHKYWRLGGSNNIHYNNCVRFNYLSLRGRVPFPFAELRRQIRTRPLAAAMLAPATGLHETLLSDCRARAANIIER